MWSKYNNGEVQCAWKHGQCTNFLENRKPVRLQYLGNRKVIGNVVSGRI